MGGRVAYGRSGRDLDHSGRMAWNPWPYAVTRDGNRFLMYVSDTKAPPPSITVVVNWPALLKQ